MATQEEAAKLVQKHLNPSSDTQSVEEYLFQGIPFSRNEEYYRNTPQFNNVQRAGGIGGMLRDATNSTMEAIGFDHPFPGTRKGRRDIDQFRLSSNTFSREHKGKTLAREYEEIQANQPQYGPISSTPSLRETVTARLLAINEKLSAYQGLVETESRGTTESQNRQMLNRLKLERTQLEDMLVGLSDPPNEGEINGIKWRFKP